MENKIYDKNYNHVDMVIPSWIWNDQGLNGMQILMYALYWKLSSKGKAEFKYLSKMQAKILRTHEKDIKYNVKELARKGYIKVRKEDKWWMIRITKTEHAQPASNETNGLF